MYLEHIELPKIISPILSPPSSVILCHWKQRQSLSEKFPKKMQEAIRLERRIELAFEGHRFFDVRRWMIAETTENQQMHGYKITRSTNGIEKGEKVKVRKHTFREAMYFFPIPYKETVKSDDLLQNPYYE